MNDLETLRPEVAEAIRLFGAVIEELGLHDNYESALHVLCAELLRLAKEVDRRFGIGGELIAARRERDEAQAELAALKARIDGSRHAFLGPNMDRITFLAEDIGPVGKYALVKVED